jgi:2-dehydropantoate 2-reductase
MPHVPKVLVVGGGGVGTIAAYNLEQGGRCSVTMVLRSNYAAVKEKGYTIESCDHGNIGEWRPAGGLLPHVPHHNSTSLNFDYIVCCTKNTPDIAPALVDIVRPAITSGRSVVVLIQNGLNIDKPFLEALPDQLILSGVSLCGAEEPAPGHILHTGRDKLLIGAFANPRIPQETRERTARAFVDLYQASGKAEAEFDGDVAFSRWKKAMFNAVFNPISALTDLDTSRLRLSAVAEPAERNSIIDGLIRPAMEEIRQAAWAVSGVKLEANLVGELIEADPIDAFIMPSMQQDARKNRFLECEVIMGEAVRLGESAHVPMPIIRTLYHLCKAIQFRIKEDRHMLDLQSLVKLYAGSNRTMSSAL